MISSLSFRGLNALTTQSFRCGIERGIHCTAACNDARSGRYRKIQGRKQLLTYEMANPPHEIAHKKSWTAWNTTTLKGGKRSQLTAIEDMFICRFIDGTFFGNVLGKHVIIKRQHNIIRIAACIHKGLSAQQMYFLMGYAEEMLSQWLQGPVKLEIQMIEKHEGYVKVL